MQAISESLIQLFEKWAETTPESITALPISGSERRYFRIKGGVHSIIAAYNENITENRAFLSFTKTFLTLGIKVPEVYLVAADEKSYLQEDLGTEILLNQVIATQQEWDNGFPSRVLELYKNALKQLASLQIKAANVIDYTKCYPTAIFDEQSMLWDCHQFKYCYLQTTGILFDERRLAGDFKKLANFLSEANSEFFMFRDFQARNIMVKNSDLSFIDYQGGRKGPLQYDVASLLFQAKANLPNNVREKLLDFYIQEAQQLTDLNTTAFKAYYYGFVCLRAMQVLGAYGFKGYYQRKSHFITSIPFALKNLDWLLNSGKIPQELPYLEAILKTVVVKGLELTEPTLKAKETTLVKGPTLNLHIKSFSYHRGLPKDVSGHGIGYVFDCRIIHNPGRYMPYKQLSGLDQAVKDFLNKEVEMGAFFKHIRAIITQAIDKYLQRGFTDLGINFGCTGGQHRSVFAAEVLAKYVATLPDALRLQIHVEHKERSHWPTKNSF